MRVSRSNPNEKGDAMASPFAGMNWNKAYLAAAACGNGMTFEVMPILAQTK